MTRLNLISAISAAGILFSAPAAFSQDWSEFVVRVPEPNIVIPGLEPNPQAQVEVDANLGRRQLGFDQGANDQAIPRMNRSQRRELAARCDVILSNPGAYSMDAVSLCETALIDR